MSLGPGLNVTENFGSDGIMSCAQQTSQSLLQGASAQKQMYHHLNASPLLVNAV